MLGLFIPNMQAQIVSVATGSGFNIKAGTIIGAEGLDITPSADFSLSSSLSRSTTISNTTTLPHINRSYKLGATTAAFSGALQLNYQDSELNGLTENNLKLLYNDGTAWAASSGSINNAIANYETATLTAKPLNELSLGISNGTSTTILDSQCGSTLADITSTISCYPVTGATSYKFKIVDMSTNVTQYYFTAINSFNLKMLSGTFYATSYAISVAATVGGSLKAYGSSCTITTPYPVTKVQSTQCGTTLAALNTTISAVAVTNATGYRFEVTNNSTVYTYDSLTNSFNLSMLSSPVFYGETYAVRVSVKYNTIWQPYGDSCLVYTPSSPAKVQATQCGATIAALNTTIYSVAVTGATGYRFEVTNGNDVYTYDSLTNYFNLMQLNGVILYGSTYSIRVSVKLYNVWQPYGASCSVATPVAPLTKLQTTQCGITLASGNATVLSAIAVAVAQKYRFEVSLGSSVYTYDTASSSVRSFKMTAVSGLTLVSGTTYTVRVAIKANGVWQPYGSSCNITTFGVAPIARLDPESITEATFNVSANPNPFIANFTFSLITSSEEKVAIMVYDMTGRLLDRQEVSPSAILELQIGDLYPSGVYNIIVSQGNNIKTLRLVKRQ